MFEEDGWTVLKIFTKVNEILILIPWWIYVILGLTLAVFGPTLAKGF